MALPQRPPTFLRRERLSRRLDEGLRTPLTVVNGGAGAGKTLLVADWAAGLAVPVAWLTAEAGDRRPGVFWAYLLEALRGCGAGVSAAVRVPGDAVRVERRTLALLADELSAREEPVVVVVDEFERVGGGEVAEQVEYVLRHVGGGLRLVLVSRAEPLLPLHRYRVAGELTEVRGAELAFTPEEAVTLLESHGLSVPVASARALVERTRGWAAGLRLCAMAALESDDPEVYLKEFEAGRSTVADFLLAEVLARQPVDAQDLLLRVSVLTRFGPDLANALTGRSDAEPLLVGLHEANAFVERLGHGWFRLHPLFREILLAHLRVRLPGLEPALRLRAARWLLRSGDLAEALAHGSAAGEWDFTADALVGDLAIGQLFAGLRAGHFGPLFAGMAADADADSVPADLVRAALEMETGVETGVGMSVHRGVRYLRAAEERLGAGVSESSGAAPLGSPGSPRSPGSPGAGPAALASCALLRALAARLTGDPAGAALAAERFQEVYGDVSPSLFDRHPEFLALLHVHLGSAYLWGGRFQDAREVLMGVGGAVPPVHADALGQLALIDYLYGWGARGERRVVGDGGRESASLLGGCGLGGLVLAAVAVERDELDRAQALLDESAGGKGNGGGGFPAVDPLVVAVRGLVRARLLLARGHPSAACAAADPEISAVLPSPWVEEQRALILACARLAGGRDEEAGEVVAEAVGELVGGDPGEYGSALGAVEAARVLLAAGRAEDAAGLVRRVRGDRHAGPAVTVRASLVRARLALAAGDTPGARRLVGQALLDGRRERLRRPFLDARDWIGPLLTTPPLAELAASWLPYGPPVAVAGTAPLVGELSAREREVLRGLAAMMSTQDIAADLCVSVNTVKTHLKGVYRKLAVNRRNDAVRRARELGLL